MTASLATSKLSLEFQAHNDQITKMQVMVKDDEMTLYTSSRDKTIKRWLIGQGATEERTKKVTLSCEGHGHHVNGFALSPQGDYLVSCSSDRTLRIWRTDEQSAPIVLGAHTKDVLCVGVDKCDGKYIVSGGRDGKIFIWNTKGEKKGELFSEAEGHKSWITDVITIPKMDEFVISSSEDGSIIEWNIETESIKKKLLGHDQAVVALTISPDGSLCASAGLDRRIFLWDLKNVDQKCEIKIDDQIHCLQFALSAYWLAAGTDNSIVVWDIFEKEVIAEIPHEDGERKKSPCTSLCWANKFTLFAGYRDGTVRQFTFNVA